MILKAIPFVLLLAVTGCSDEPGETPEQQEMKSARWAELEAVPEDAEIRVQGQGCFFCCPQYTLTVDADGHVTFLATHNLSNLGTFERDVDPTIVLELIHSAASISYADIELNDDAGNCGTDGETVESRVTAAELSHTISRYDCDKDTSRRVKEFEQEVLDATTISEWFDQQQVNCGL